ncbi:hypothetical protein [Amaricoccus solimangrovi]|uniref:Helix-turn-helix domain-containing protein n=1 Tax=Amaricoccus solimangrovi TaxID=2589815 RepID=A0A501WCW9_9RHOB|nr:hypothetical protein [Amaricoccus solimangrovi]TPE47238.1 hypothetical protein FJM51_20505 [Amaricoccus solimangrovi]
MTGLNTTELARAFGVSKARISQLVSEGKLDGCYHGERRQRRFDPVACAEALGRRIDPGQRLGNGAGTQRAAARIMAGSPVGTDEQAPRSVAPALPVAGPTETPYEAARTLKAQEDARRARRQNLEEERAFVLASEVERQAQRQMARELGEVLAFLRGLARSVADAHQLDARVVRKLILDEWRRHRGDRADAAELVERDALLSDAESEEDF